MSKTDAARRKSRKHIVDDLKRRLKNAKRRAVYWSGRPSFQGYGFVPGNRSRSKLGHPDLEYEVAMNDIDSLCTSKGYLMFDSLRVKNYRCFKDLKLEKLRRLNVIVGDNGSGKTALLEALYVMSGSPGVQIQLRANLWRGILSQLPHSSADRPSFESMWRDMFFQLDMSKTAMLEGIDSSKGCRRLNIFLDSSEATLPDLAEALDSPIVSYSPLILEWTVDGKHSRVKIDESGKPQITGELPRFPVIFLAPTNPHPGDDSTRFSDLSKKRELDPITSVLQEQFPAIQGLSLEEHHGSNVIFADIISLPYKIPLGLYSAGAKKLLSILLAIAHEPAGVIIVDELENGFYFERFHSIWQALLSRARDLNSQIFASTHSRECLEALALVMSDSEDELSLIRVERVDEASVAKQFAGKNAIAAIGRGMNVR